MRVISGTRKRLQLQTVSGIHTRPTQDRIKETLFNMIQNDCVTHSFWMCLLEVDRWALKH